MSSGNGPGGGPASAADCGSLHLAMMIAVPALTFGLVLTPLR